MIRWIAGCIHYVAPGANHGSSGYRRRNRRKLQDDRHRARLAQSGGGDLRLPRGDHRELADVASLAGQAKGIMKSGAAMSKETANSTALRVAGRMTQEEQ